MSMTVGELFAALATRFNHEAAAGMNRTLQWKITDEDPGVWAFEIKNGQGRLIPAGSRSPTRRSSPAARPGWRSRRAARTRCAPS